MITAFVLYASLSISKTQRHELQQDRQNTRVHQNTHTEGQKTPTNRWIIDDLGVQGMSDIPVHDLHIDKTTASNNFSGDFWIGQPHDTTYVLPYKPTIFVAPDATTFAPGSQWQSVLSDCHVVLQGNNAEGAKVHFTATFPTGINHSKFFVAVQMRGTSGEDDPKDEVSIAASRYPSNHVNLKTRVRNVRLYNVNGEDDSDTVVPITVMFPGSPDSQEDRYGYTNLKDVDYQFDVFHLALPSLDSSNEQANNKHTDSPEAANKRKHKIHFDKPSAPATYPYRMLVGYGDTMIPGQSAPTHEWSAVIRPAT